MKRPIRWKQLLHKLLFPHPAVVLVCVPAAAALLVWVFAVLGEDSPAAYAVYPFSAYALVIACTGLGGMVRRLTAWLLHFSLAERLVRDVPFRARVTLYLSLGINLLYVGMNLMSGVRQRSVWFGTMAVYYLFLAGMRFSLVRYARRAGAGADQAGEYRRYRLCGILLVLMNLALGGVVVLVLHREGGFSYSGYMIYAMAAYAFYATIMGVVNLVRYRRYHSPVLSASRAVSLAAALVSMLSLEVAMLAQFGSDNGEGFRTLMIGCTGFGVSAVVAGMGVSMIVRAGRALGGRDRGAAGSSPAPEMPTAVPPRKGGER